MGVCLEMENFDALFASTKNIPIIVNDFSESTEESKNKLNSMMYTKYVGDLLSNVPMCDCGNVTGKHNVGVLCDNCNTVVFTPMDQELEPLIWIRAPHGVRALMNPLMWIMINKKFTRSGFELIKWFCDTTYKATVKTPPILEAVQALGFQRGYNNFVENFDAIMEALFNLKGFRPRKGTEDPLQILLRQQRDCVFSQYLPVPNKSLLVIEETNTGTYADPIINDAIDAIRIMAGIDTELSAHSVRVKENRTVKSFNQLANYYDNFYRNIMAKKEGIFRKHIYGSRSNWSYRGVISSLTDRHDYDEIHIPWGIAVSVFSIHLANKLFRRGFTPNGVKALLNEHSQKYHPLLDELFNELIAESPDKGISAILQRN